jgi:hypothetical protein
MKLCIISRKSKGTNFVMIQGRISQPPTGQKPRIIKAFSERLTLSLALSSQISRVLPNHQPMPYVRLIFLKGWRVILLWVSNLS